MPALTVTLPGPMPAPVVEQLLERVFTHRRTLADACYPARIAARDRIAEHLEARAAGRAEALIAHVRSLQLVAVPSSLTLGPILDRKLDGPDTRDHRDRMRAQEARTLALRELDA